MSSAETPFRPVAPHAHAHEAQTAQPRRADPPLTLLGSGLAYRLGTAAALSVVLWAVVLWALR